MSEVKTCPLCDTEPEIQQQMINAVLMYNVTCFGCSAKIGFFPSKESAIRLWNTRATPKLDIEGLKREADAAYCTALDLADKNCRGAQYKLENGKFSNDDLKWHCQHNERIGYHRGMWRVLKELDHLAARGFFGVISREARLTIEGMAKQKLSEEMDRDEYEYNDGCFEDAYDEMVRHARKLEAMIKAAPKKEGK